MFISQPLLAAIILVVICIIHHVFARCQELIRKEDIFKDEIDGVENFRRAFKFLSLPELDIKLGEPEDREETATERIERSLQYELTRSYFLDLFKNHGLSVSKMDVPSRWCHRTNYNALYGKNANPERVLDMVIIHPFTDCIDFITKMMTNPEQSKNPSLVFKSMYEDWSYNNLMSDLELGTVVSTEQFDSEENELENKAKMQKNIRSYTMAYFKYYQKVLYDPELDPRNFRSISQFCEEEGNYIVMDYGYDT